MAWWILLLIQVGLQIVSGLLSSKPNAKPEKRVDLPQNDGSTPIPVVFGECLIKGATIIDYFDFKAEPIKIRNPSTFFLTTLTIGYRYYLGMVFGCCWRVRPADQGAIMTRLLIDNRLAWGVGDGIPHEGGSNHYNQLDPLKINRPSFFGAEKQEGGIRAVAVWYNGQDLTGLGAPLQADSYWQTFRGVTLPHYKDLAYFVWYGPSYGNLPFLYGGKRSGYIGNRAQLWPISFKVVRQPIMLTNGVIARPGDTPNSVGNHANPIECLYECLVDTNYGAGIPAAQIFASFGAGVTDSFAAAATTCWGEGLGFSYLWTTASPVEEMVAEILRYVEGVIWTDLQSGLIKIRLIRPLVATLELSNDDFIEIESFTRGSWEDTKNEVRVTFPDHSKVDFENSTAYWQDLANTQIQGVIDPVEITYNGCPSSTLANRLAARDGRVYATPLAKLSGKLDRKGWQLHPGSVFLFTWPEQGISQMTMRVANTRYGTILDGTIQINAVEDIFKIGEATYGTPTTTIWTDPLAANAQDASGDAGEIPYWFQRDNVPRAFGVATRPASSHVSYDGAIDGESDAINTDFAPSGTLAALLPQLSTTDYDTTGFNISGVTLDSDQIAAGTSTSIANEGAGLAIIGTPSGTHEWIAFESVTDNGGGSVTLDNVWRGVMDTPPREHAAGATIWFFSVGSALFVKSLANGQSVTFEALTRTMRDQLTTTEATNRALTIQSRALRPLPPYYILLGGSYTNERQDTGDLVFTWREHSRLTQTQVQKQSATTDAAEAGVTYEIDIYDVSTGTPALLRNVTGLASATYTYTNADELSDLGSATLALLLRLDFYSKRDTRRSLYPWERSVYRVDPAAFGNSQWVLPSQVYDDPHAAATETGYDELGTEVFS